MTPEQLVRHNQRQEWWADVLAKSIVGSCIAFACLVVLCFLVMFVAKVFNLTQLSWWAVFAPVWFPVACGVGLFVGVTVWDFGVKVRGTLRARRSRKAEEESTALTESRFRQLPQVEEVEESEMPEGI
jgi:hypothetical protein